MTQDLSKWGTRVPSEYTATLGAVIDMGYNTDDKLHLSSDYYPIFDEAHRAELNDKICQNYMLREIGQETVQQFVFYLGMTLNQIMPYFNERYRTLALKYDPLNTVEMTSENTSNTVAQSSGKTSASQDSSTKSTSDGTSSSSTKSQSYDSEVPATGVQGDFARYATHANQAQADTDGSSHSAQDTTSQSHSTSSTEWQHDATDGSSSSHTSGRSQSAMSLITEYRNAIINVDMEVIHSLEPCFMQIWGSYDTIFSNCYNYGEGE